jgi:hypothetical protein
MILTNPAGIAAALARHSWRTPVMPQTAGSNIRAAVRYRLDCRHRVERPSLDIPWPCSTIPWKQSWWSPEAAHCARKFSLVLPGLGKDYTGLAFRAEHHATCPRGVICSSRRGRGAKTAKLRECPDAPGASGAPGVNITRPMEARVGALCSKPSLCNCYT